MRIHAFTLRRPASRQARRLSLLMLAALGAAAIGAGSGQAADPFVAGGRSTRPVAASADELGPARAHGKALAAGLGLPATSFRAERLDDRFDHRVYDEVTGLDGHGRVVAVARFDLDGRLLMASELGWAAHGGTALDQATVSGRALAVARAAGVRVSGAADVRRSAGGGGWSAAWARSVDGIPVRGDGVRLLLWSDGSFHGIVRTERSLAAEPANPLSGADAARAASVVVGRTVAAPAGLTAATPALAWVAPNDMFGGPRIDAPAELLRLAWVVRYDASGSLAERVRSIEVWIDAGDGRVIGGDVVE
jgi:hypothetical protein